MQTDIFLSTTCILFALLIWQTIARNIERQHFYSSFVELKASIKDAQNTLAVITKEQEAYEQGHREIIESYEQEYLSLTEDIVMYKMILDEKQKKLDEIAKRELPRLDDYSYDV